MENAAPPVPLPITGFSGSCSVNLSNKYYYKYVGSQTPLAYQYDTNGVITTSNYYKECKTTATATPTTTIKISGSNSTVVSGITVNGVQIMSGATAASSSSGTVAAYIAAKISLNGYSATYSGSTVTISGPTSAAGYTPVVSCTSCGMSFATTSKSSSIPRRAAMERRMFRSLRKRLIRRGFPRSFS